MARLSLLICSSIFAVTLPSAAAVKFLKQSPGSSGGKKRVAFAAFVTGLSGEAWEDAAAVLAHGIHEAGRRSRHDVEAVVLAPESLPDDVEKKLLGLGFDKVFKRPVPVQAEEVRDATTKKELMHIQGNGLKGASFSLVEEGIKYQALGLTEYDRVLMLDLDTMILQPMDAIIDAKEDLVGTYDVAMESNMHNAVPVVQGGFLMMRPNVSDLEEIKRTTREGTFNGGGWQNSHIGFAYGGVGPQGMFSYHFHRDLLPTLNKYSTSSPERKALLAEVDPEHTKIASVEGKRFLALDRRAYDVLDTPFTQAELNGEDIKVTMGRVRSAHFTGGCGKPWSCAGSGSELCKGLTNEWWRLRSSLAASWGVPDTARCQPGHRYEVLARPKKN